MGGLHGMDEHAARHDGRRRPCRLRLEARPRDQPRGCSTLTPLLAVALTVVAGFFMFLLWATTRSLALYHFFVSPVNSLYGLSELR